MAPIHLKHPLLGGRYELFWRMLCKQGVARVLGLEAAEDDGRGMLSAPAILGQLPPAFRIIEATAEKLYKATDAEVDGWNLIEPSFDAPSEDVPVLPVAKDVQAASDEKSHEVP